MGGAGAAAAEEEEAAQYWSDVPGPGRCRETDSITPAARRLPLSEPVLGVTRKVVKPFNGLDVSPIVWVALLSFVSEILTGPQGILSLIERKGIL